MKFWTTNNETDNNDIMRWKQAKKPSWFELKMKEMKGQKTLEREVTLWMTWEWQLKWYLTGAQTNRQRCGSSSLRKFSRCFVVQEWVRLHVSLMYDWCLRWPEWLEHSWLKIYLWAPQLAAENRGNVCVLAFILHYVDVSPSEINVPC